jgi:hypothetical protein
MRSKERQETKIKEKRRKDNNEESGHKNIQLTRRKKMKIELLVDGRKIPMNDFVQKIVGNVIQAIVETLHTIDGGWQEISIHIEKGK